jgi:hypothetical protein
MAKLLDNANDDSVVPETSYQDDPKPTSQAATSKSIWAIGIVAVFVGALALYVGTGTGSHTDPAPNGSGGNVASPAQPAPAQNN